MLTQNNFIPKLEKATLRDYPTVQNMARFYIYDISRHCGVSTNHNWACPEDGLYEAPNFKKYFVEDDRYPFLVKVDEELAGFVLINKVGTDKQTDWNMGEFYIVAKFQRTGVAAQVFKQVLAKFFGQWEVAAIPENTPAVKFWHREVNKNTDGNYQE